MKNWELISFVNGRFSFNDTRKQIIMLVKNRETQKIKLRAIFIDPWKDIDLTKPFDEPENIFQVKSGNIDIPL